MALKMAHSHKKLRPLFCRRDLLNTATLAAPSPQEPYSSRRSFQRLLRLPSMRITLDRLPAVLFIMAAALFLNPVQGAAASSTPEEVSYQSGPETVHALLYKPANSAAKSPAIIVIHEWWGLNDWVKEQAADLAAHGYVALAVDIRKLSKPPTASASPCFLPASVTSGIESGV